MSCDKLAAGEPTASSGPTLERTRTLGDLSGSQASCAQVRERLVSKVEAFGASGSAQQQQPPSPQPLAASFSFNSYQDILCWPSSQSSTSTFAASDVKRSLEFQRRAHLTQEVANAEACCYQRRRLPAKSSTFSSPKFRVHARQRSVGGHANQVAALVSSGQNSFERLPEQEQNASLVQLKPIEEKPQVAAVAKFHSHTAHQQPIGKSERESQQQEAKRLHLSKRKDRKQLCKKHQQEEHQNVKPKIETMSHSALQSIQSLSMQLNQQAAGNLRPGSASLGELSQVSGGAQQQQQQHAKDSGKLTRLVGKKAARVKELLLQNLGKADKTTDELFQMYEENFYKQQAHAVKLQKEFKQHVSALKGAHDSGKSLNLSIQQATSDYQSARHDLVCENLTQLEHLKEDLMEKLRTQILTSMNEYLSQFDELKEKIAKRKRKLIDHDSSRRIYELMLAAVNKKRQAGAQQHQAPSAAPKSFRSPFRLGGGGESSGFQSATSQLVDEARLLKLREQYNYCKIMFETINQELYEQLPMLYEKKMKHLLMSLQSYFSIEAQFHSNASKLFATAGDVIDELPSSGASSSESYRAALHRRHHANCHQEDNEGEEEEDDDEDDEEEEEEVTEEDLANAAAFAGAAKQLTAGATSGASSGVGSSRGGDSSLASSSNSPAAEREEVEEHEEDESVDPASTSEQLDPAEHEQVQGKVEALATDDEPDAAVAASNEREDEREIDAPSAEPLEKEQIEVEPKKVEPEEEKDVQVGKCEKSVPQAISQLVEAEASGVVASEGFLYKVKTSYKYLAEDVDELCFEADEIIQVVEFEPNQEPEDGWLMGIREVNGQKGLFPANFTQPI